METFDFGLGHVPAHRHVNPNTSIGGWVADTAWVYGNARVYGDARVYGNAQVYGNAWVSGNAWVYGDARVYGDAHWLSIGPIGSRGAFLTVTFKPSLHVTTGCFEYKTIEEFRTAIVNTHGDSQYAKEYFAVIELIETIEKLREV